MIGGSAVVSATERGVHEMGSFFEIMARQERQESFLVNQRPTFQPRHCDSKRGVDIAERVFIAFDHGLVKLRHFLLVFLGVLGIVWPAC